MATVTGSDVVATAVKTSDWGSGFEGQFHITNHNPYDVLNWTMDLECPETFTWFSDGDVTRHDDKGPPSRPRSSITPKEWKRVIRAGSTVVMGFGGTAVLPGNLVFNQVLPLIGEDPTLLKRGDFGDKAVAPYVDACAFPTPDLVAVAKDSGLEFFTMAFIVASRDNRPAWGGTIPLDTQYLLDQVRQIRGAGGDVVVSFGGANGIELAQAIKDVDLLVRAYEDVIDMYSLVRVDFDIEGGAVADKASVDRRNRALAQVQKLYPKIQITYCLPVLPTGLTPDGEAVLVNAHKHGVKLAGIHGMSMGKLRMSLTRACTHRGCVRQSDHILSHCRFRRQCGTRPKGQDGAVRHPIVREPPRASRGRRVRLAPDRDHPHGESIVFATAVMGVMGVMGVMVATARAYSYMPYRLV